MHLNTGPFTPSYQRRASTYISICDKRKSVAWSEMRPLQETLNPKPRAGEEEGGIGRTKTLREAEEMVQLG